jgi:hypothetical protein
MLPDIDRAASWTLSNIESTRLTPVSQDIYIHLYAKICWLDMR